MVETKKPTLVILAAGMGSRYGGLKQMDVFTTEGDTIMDFSIYDAISAGFGKIVFIIREAFENEFRALIDHKLDGKVEVNYVFQEIDGVPAHYSNPGRTKPWGTGHALLMAKDVVHENFAVINADDFYGREAFEVMAKSLVNKNKQSYEFNMMAYLLKNTVSEYGHVARGECKVNEHGFLVDVTERTQIEQRDGQFMRLDEQGQYVPIDGDTIVSMNFWGFTPKCFEFGAKLFEQFQENNKNNPTAEFYIPYVVNEILKSDKAIVEVLTSNSQWFGVTYKEDKLHMQNAIQQLKETGVYPKKLW